MTGSLRDLTVAALYGVLEGITEWLPISSTGHLLLLRELLPLPVSEAFWEVFLVVIQLGAVLAVVVRDGRRMVRDRSDLRTEAARGGRVLLACLPAVAAGLLLDDLADRVLFRYEVVAAALIVYGVLFLLPIRRRVRQAGEPDLRTALGVGCFQVLALVPGTSRSGATILGGQLLGLSRPAAAEFSFRLAVPIMAGASLLRLARFWLGGGRMTATEGLVLLVGCGGAFLVSLVALEFLVAFVRERSFRAFGWYRIALGAAVLLYFKG